MAIRRTYRKNEQVSASEIYESIERRAMLAWHAAAARRGLAGDKWRIERIGDAICSVSSSDPSILINRVFGLGATSTPYIEQLIGIRQLYEEAGVARFFLHILSELADTELEQTLAAAGFRRHRGWMKFTRGTGDIRAAETDLTVRRINADQAEVFAAIAAPAFDLQASSQPALAALADDSGWHLYMSFDGDDPAGTGALYAMDGVGYLDWGATHPQYRCRGSQTAVLSRRIRDALDLGCDTIVTMTGEEVPGDPQHSYANILRSGFSEAYLRENWIPVDS